MTQKLSIQLFDHDFYLFGSRAATHVVFWITYYLVFSLIWVKPETGYLGSFFLEFILLPVRIMSVYGMLYVLMPRYLLLRRYRDFFLAYVGMMLLAGLLQRLAGHFFYETLYLGSNQPLWQTGEWLRGIMLVNSTVVFVSAIRLLQLYLRANDQLSAQGDRLIEIKSNRRTHLVHPDQILYIEGLGNYVSYFLVNDEKLIAYSSIKSTLENLPEDFIRLHKSYIVNRKHIESFNSENVSIGTKLLPRGKEISDHMLRSQ